MSYIDDSFYDDGRASLEELLAKGEYESNKDNILKGFKIFQKRYVYKSIALQLLLVALGIASQVLNIAYAAEGEDVSFSYLLIVMCVVLGVYILIRPKNTFRRLADSISDLDGTLYSGEIYTNKIIITTLYDPYTEKSESDEEEVQEKKIEETPSDEASSEEEYEGPPATIIHLDNSGVEITETADLFVVYIKKINVYVIPKSAFKPYEVIEIGNRLSNIMGIRYRKD